MGKDDISVQFLIHLVSERPALWDKTSEDYKDRGLKQTSWREICVCINENFYHMEPEARQEFTRMIIKKWTHIRDSWVKSMKYGFDKITFLPPRPYVYHKEMQFMQKILNCKPQRHNFNTFKLSKGTQNSNGTSQDMDNDEKEADCDDGDLNIEKFKREPITNIIDDTNVTVVNKAEDSEDDWHFENTEITQTQEDNNDHNKPTGKKRNSIFLSTCNEEQTVELPVVLPNQNTNENRHWGFFRGILPSLTGLDEDHILRFQSGIIHLIQNLRQSQKQTIRESNRMFSHSLSKGRGKKRKVSLDDTHDEFAMRHNNRTRTQISDPIGSENEGTDKDYLTDS